MHRQVMRWSMRLVLIAACLAASLFVAGCPGTGGAGSGGTGTGDPIQVDTVGQGTVEQAVDGNTIALTATPATGWVFDQWTGADIPDPQANPLVLAADDNVTSVTATFVEDGSGQPIPGDDSDDDNVPDDQDACPDTPPGEQVDETGCAASERDSDGDGVNDDEDQCPTTPAGVDVDGNGCPVSVDDTIDADEDGVPDDIDQCEGTPAGVTVDANGCSDTDGDGVADNDDLCDGTPAGADVDADGCAESERDSDDDGIHDDTDECPNTPAGEDVDDVGCADGQLDGDGDGVPDDMDNCPATPRGQDVDPNTGCPPSVGPPPDDPPTGGLECGNGTVEPDEGEECDDGGESATCDANCTFALCGDGTVNAAAGEQCDDGNIDPGDGCDADCQTEIPAGENDDCAHPLNVGAETISFSNVGATTDGPEEPGRCALLDVTQIDADVWFLFTSPCTDDVVVSACGAPFDTKLAVYEGSECPTTESITCSDDDCGPGQGARLQFPALTGAPYLIRVGGFDGAEGNGTLTIYCASDPDFGIATCGVGTNDCFQTGDGPGCATEACCLQTCAIDPFCCDTDWDALCAEKASDVICRDTPPEVCGAGSGDCNATIGNGTKGCEDALCCQAVCLEDPFCCLTEWDDICALAAGSICGSFEVCETATSDCLAEQTTPGCGVQSCCNAVCSVDPACCETAWDDLCAERAANIGECQ